MGDFDERPQEQAKEMPFRGFESVDAAEWKQLVARGQRFFPRELLSAIAMLNDGFAPWDGE